MGKIKRILRWLYQEEFEKAALQYLHEEDRLYKALDDVQNLEELIEMVGYTVHDRLLPRPIDVSDPSKPPTPSREMSFDFARGRFGIKKIDH